MFKKTAEMCLAYEWIVFKTKHKNLVYFYNVFSHTPRIKKKLPNHRKCVKDSRSDVKFHTHSLKNPT